MSIYKLLYYIIFPTLFIALTYNKKQSPAIWCNFISFLDHSFPHIPHSLSNYNKLIAYEHLYIIKLLDLLQLWGSISYHQIQVVMNFFFANKVNSKAIMS